MEKDKEKFNPSVHITKLIVHLDPSKKHFTLTAVSDDERVTSTDKASKKPSKKHSQSESKMAIEP